MIILNIRDWEHPPFACRPRMLFSGTHYFAIVKRNIGLPILSHRKGEQAHDCTGDPPPSVIPKHAQLKSYGDKHNRESMNKKSFFFPSFFLLFLITHSP
jgi:hypothetical protein